MLNTEEKDKLADILESKAVLVTAEEYEDSVLSKKNTKIKCLYLTTIRTSKGIISGVRFKLPKETKASPMWCVWCHCP